MELPAPEMRQPWLPKSMIEVTTMPPQSCARLNGNAATQSLMNCYDCGARALKTRGLWEDRMQGWAKAAVATALVVGWAAVEPAARADDYPVRPVRMVVGFGPGA